MITPIENAQTKSFLTPNKRYAIARALLAIAAVGFLFIAAKSSSSLRIGLISGSATSAVAGTALFVLKFSQKKPLEEWIEPKRSPVNTKLPGAVFNKDGKTYVASIVNGQLLHFPVSCTVFEPQTPPPTPVFEEDSTDSTSIDSSAPPTPLAPQTPALEELSRATKQDVERITTEALVAIYDDEPISLDYHAQSKNFTEAEKEAFFIHLTLSSEKSPLFTDPELTSRAHELRTFYHENQASLLSLKNAYKDTLQEPPREPTESEKTAYTLALIEQRSEG